MWPEVGILTNGGQGRRIVPDVAVVRRPPPETGAGGVATLAAPRRTLSPAVEVRFRGEQIRHPFVEIRDPARGHQLITLIEIVSPSNKVTGPDRDAYLRKQNEVLSSSASLIEIDLLRSGERLFASPGIHEAVYQMERAPDYLVLVNRAWQRAGGELTYQVFPILITDALPCVPVPLREGEEEIPLDLQFAFQQTYDTGPYRRGAVNYQQPPRPPLSSERAAWAEERLRAAGLISPPPG
jgi:hypothetical protein